MVAKRLIMVLLCLGVMAAPAFGAAKDVIYASESTPKSLDPTTPRTPTPAPSRRPCSKGSWGSTRI